MASREVHAELSNLSRFSCDNNFADAAAMEGLFSSVLPSLASALAGGTDDERVEALGQLAQVVDTSFGDDAVQVGGYLREHGVLTSLVWLLEHSDAVAIQQTTLLILGNLASDAVDPRSAVAVREKLRVKSLKVVAPPELPLGSPSSSTRNVAALQRARRSFGGRKARGRASSGATEMVPPDGAEERRVSMSRPLMDAQAMQSDL